MKKIFYFMMIVVALGATGCSRNKKECVIEGTINPRFEGRRIFLVPLEGPQDAAHVDSTVVKDGRFRFVKDTVGMEVIRVDYHVRTGVQDLLVVTEPGRVEVRIDTLSDGGGTPQNDSLSKWKAMSAEYNRERVLLIRAARVARQSGDTAILAKLDEEMNSLYRAHRERTRQLAKNMKEGVLHDFLESMFPRTYEKRMPDGSVVTVENE